MDYRKGIVQVIECRESI